jgi:tetratricopeptide (TPR) repeat protein
MWATASPLNAYLRGLGVAPYEFDRASATQYLSVSAQRHSCVSLGVAASGSSLKRDEALTSKKRSAASSSRRKPPVPLVSFIDRSRGRKKVPATPRNPTRPRARRPRARRAVSQAPQDVIWLTEAGAQHWVVITRDDRIRYNQLENRPRFDAFAALNRVQTLAGLKRQIESFGPLAHALGYAEELQNDIPRLQQQINRNLQSLDVGHLAPSGHIIDRFRDAVAGGDHDAIYQALAQSECWSSFAFERALAQHAIATVIADDASARQWNALARRFALAYCRSFLDRGPFDEYALYTTWPEDKRLIKARAYALKLNAIQQATSDDHDAAHATLQAALELHVMIGDRDAAGRWFPQAFQELAVPPASRRGMHRLMFRASQEGFLASRDHEQRTLEELLDQASREGATLDVVDASTRLGIHYVQAQCPAEAEEWFARAEQGFRALESIGISVREEAGRAHNKLKMNVHLLEFLEQSGRFGEAAFVGVAALREAAWFIESFQHFEYGPRAMDYKSRMLHALTRSYERLGGYEKALAYADQLRGWSEKIGDQSALGAAHHSRALALRGLLKPSDALPCAQADLDIQRELDNPREIAVALVLCAELSMDVGDTDRPRVLAREAIELAATHPTATSSGRDAKYVLARLAQHDGALSETIRLYSEILAEEEALPGREWIATAGVLAERLLSAGRVADACALAQRAWEASEPVHSLPIRLNAGARWPSANSRPGRASRFEEPSTC